jgi:hypothetical protein
MAKLLLTEEEELMYLNELDRIKEMIPDLEVKIEVQHIPTRLTQLHDSDLGHQYKLFLHNSRKEAVDSVHQ